MNISLRAYAFNQKSIGELHFDLPRGEQQGTFPAKKLGTPRSWTKEG
jgi:hypothetical protein